MLALVYPADIQQRILAAYSSYFERYNKTWEYFQLHDLQYYTLAVNIFSVQFFLSPFARFSTNEFREMKTFMPSNEVEMTFFALRLVFSCTKEEKNFKERSRLLRTAHGGSRVSR